METRGVLVSKYIIKDYLVEKICYGWSIYAHLLLQGPDLGHEFFGANMSLDTPHGFDGDHVVVLDALARHCHHLLKARGSINVDNHWWWITRRRVNGRGAISYVSQLRRNLSRKGGQTCRMGILAQPSRGTKGGGGNCYWH